MVDYFVQQDFFDKKIYCTAYLEEVHLQDRLTGFLHSSRQFSHVNDVADSGTELFIFDNIEPFDPMLQRMDSPCYKMIYQYSRRNTWAKVYERK